MRPRLTSAPEAADQGVLQEPKPVINGVQGVPGIVPVEFLGPLVEVLGDLQAGAERETQIVEGAQPGVRLRVVEDDLRFGEPLQDGLGGLALALPPPGPGVTPALPR